LSKTVLQKFRKLGPTLESSNIAVQIIDSKVQNEQQGDQTPVGCLDYEPIGIVDYEPSGANIVSTSAACLKQRIVLD
jgi:hypothetical protein